ncbi:MAG: hypothetical protein AAFY78_00840 [Cyanobacteria bacterium J06648_16]
MPSQKLRRGFACLASVLASTLGSGLFGVAAVAQDSEIDAPLPEPMTLAQRRVQVLDLALVPVEMSPSADAIATGLAITHETLSETDMTAPSLWWQQDKIGEIGPLNGSSRVVMGWAAHRRPSDRQHHVDVAVNGQIWNLLNYLEKYALITQFGQAAKTYGYHLRVFNGSLLVGGHVCNFDQTLNFSEYETLSSEQLIDIPCAVELDYLGQGAIRGGSANPF